LKKSKGIFNRCAWSLAIRAEEKADRTGLHAHGAVQFGKSGRSDRSYGMRGLYFPFRDARVVPCGDHFSPIDFVEGEQLAFAPKRLDHGVLLPKRRNQPLIFRGSHCSRIGGIYPEYRRFVVKAVGDIDNYLCAVGTILFG
jgi:hypothetical protein